MVASDVDAAVQRPTAAGRFATTASRRLGQGTQFARGLSYSC
jgi:hypothetical protein